MVLIVSINFISSYAGSISCFKIIQTASAMPSRIWLLRDVTTPAPTTKHITPQRTILKPDIQRLPVVLQWESFVGSCFLKLSVRCCWAEEPPKTAALDKPRVDVCVSPQPPHPPPQQLSESLEQHPCLGC